MNTDLIYYSWMWCFLSLNMPNLKSSRCTDPRIHPLHASKFPSPQNETIAHLIRWPYEDIVGFMGTTSPTHSFTVHLHNLGAETKFKKGASNRNIAYRYAQSRGSLSNFLFVWPSVFFYVLFLWESLMTNRQTNEHNQLPNLIYAYVQVVIIW